MSGMLVQRLAGPPGLLPGCNRGVAQAHLKITGPTSASAGGEALTIDDIFGASLDVSEVLYLAVEQSAYEVYYNRSTDKLQWLVRGGGTGQGTESFDVFDAQAADTAWVSVLAAADNTTAWTLDNQPDTAGGRNVTVGIKNNTGGQASGTQTVATVTGVDATGTSVVETHTFTTANLLDMADQAVVVKTGVKAFAQITSIVLSVAQPVDFQHRAGVADLFGIPGSIANASFVNVVKNKVQITAPTISTANNTIDLSAVTDNDDFSIVAQVGNEVPAGTDLSGTVLRLVAHGLIS